MKLKGIRIKNFRSIVDSGDIRIESLQSLVGENNSGKSNILHAIEIFLTAGTANIKDDDFFNINESIIITGIFEDLNESERANLRPYLIGNKLILEKHIEIKMDTRSEKLRPSTEYHGYRAKPKDWWLSVDGVIEHENSERPNWKIVAQDNGILDYVADETERVTKTSYESGLKRIILEHPEIEFEEPELGQTQALGLQQVLLDSFPSFHILPAITDYSDEIDRRTTNTNFRRLMSDLSERIIRKDPQYENIERYIKLLKYLLNPPNIEESRQPGEERLEILGTIETKLKNVICKLMPSVCGIQISVDIEEIRDIFSRGVSIKVDDGKLTDVLMKGHGLQRMVVFGLLQALIMNQRGELISASPEVDVEDNNTRTIILAIEEPELYIHPQTQRMIYSVLKSFAETDQVVYSTHSPNFIDLNNYEGIAVVNKESVAIGTKICQCTTGIFESESERKDFQFINSFNIEKNRMFFAKKVILVEGTEDEIALITSGRYENLFIEFPEEINYSIIVSNGKGEIPKCMKLLNSFNIPYVLLHELDGNPSSEENNKIRDLLDNNPAIEVQNRVEDELNYQGHFGNAYVAKRHCEDPANIPASFREKVKIIFSS